MAHPDLGGSEFEHVKDPGGMFSRHLEQPECPAQSPSVVSLGQGAAQKHASGDRFAIYFALR